MRRQGHLVNPKRIRRLMRLMGLEAIRHRTRKTKGCGSRLATLTMVFKLSLDAEKTWKRLKGHQLISKVIEGVKFVDGEMMAEAAWKQENQDGPVISRTQNLTIPLVSLGHY